ncbi:MAG TPA: hypothetical protein VFS08_03015 [Gemmatimonadaceae bacterium]|nr:hypothetical protein [Gemmatimonadaceae bacterium]
MSRTHLYRATAPAKPIASLVLAALWCGAALTALIGTAPGLVRGLPLHGTAAGVHDRVYLVVAGAAVVTALAIAASELFAGRTRLRAARLTGAVLLFLAGALGLLDTSRRVLRPGTPVPMGDAAAAPGTVRSLAPQRLFWAGLGVVGAFTVLVGGVSALRRWEQPF